MINQKRDVAMTAAIVMLTVFIMAIGDGGSAAAAQGATQAATQEATAAATATLVANTTAAGPIPQYGLFETQFAVDAQVTNVFDPIQIDVLAQFTGPDGQRVSVPAFWMQPYQQTCNQNCSVEILSPAGQPGWRVRFSPALPGDWTYKIDARDQTGTRAVAQGQFTVTPSKHPGFIRIGKNRHYFGSDNGTPYFLIGSNLGWAWSGAHGTLG
jgi:hypothetical protein